MQILSIKEKNRYNPEDFEPYLIAPDANPSSISVSTPAIPTPASSDGIMEGQRHNALVSMAGKLRHAGLDESAIEAAPD